MDDVRKAFPRQYIIIYYERDGWARVELENVTKSLTALGSMHFREHVTLYVKLDQPTRKVWVAAQKHFDAVSRRWVFINTSFGRMPTEPEYQI